MFNFASLFGAGLGEVVKDVVGSFKLSPEKKAELEAAIEANKHEIAKKELEIQEKALAATQTVVDAQKAIIVAEMSQGDKFTKRARPTIVYAGLGFIFLNHVLPAIIVYFGGKPLAPIPLPEAFWTAWELVVSVWALGRTAEKFGFKNKATSAIVGHK